MRTFEELEQTSCTREFYEERVKATPADCTGLFDEILEFAKMWGVR